MPATGSRSSYQQFNDEDDEGRRPSQDSFYDVDDVNAETVPEESNSIVGQESDEKENSTPRRFSKTCVKNVFTVLLIFIYLVLTAVAIFLAYQTISDFLDKLNQPVMSVSYKEVDSFSPPGIALFPDDALLLSCKHHYHDNIPPLVDPGTPQEGDCETTEVTYLGPFTENKQKRAVVVRGPSDVKNKELIFIQFSQNETREDFSAISYMLFAKFSDLIESANKSEFMRDCERNYSMWTFSGGFRTWVKMSLVKTSGRRSEAVEFRQESGVVKFNDKRPESEQTVQLFFVVFEWRDPYIQEIRLIVTANPWSSIGILCVVFMALFKAANFAKLTVKWIIKMRKRHLKHKARELNPIS
ncbi:proton-activated chloride channel [Poeciliopsis prolifica]|uniref:proton-activated chloride channel n=1 Tax=Poeciliopsis prolifica TaxID=188132 RepID=UPI002413F51D|nr:proton-activated chloride channel [Poeciliopsis prolifica]XP_054912995.1 proton-activated chloride channel [Poeciliopsis prolifica]